VGLTVAAGVGVAIVVTVRIVVRADGPSVPAIKAAGPKRGQQNKSEQDPKSLFHTTSIPLAAGRHLQSYSRACLMQLLKQWKKLEAAGGCRALLISRRAGRNRVYKYLSDETVPT